MMQFNFKPAAIVALTLGVALSAPAFAQSKKELAAKVVQLQKQDYEGIGRSLASQTAGQVMDAYVGALGSLPPEKREAAGKEGQAEVKKFYDSIEPVLRDRAVKVANTQVPPMLEEKMTEDELKLAITWLESSASKKFMQLGAEVPQRLAEKIVADTKGTVEPKLKTLEATLQKKLGTPAPAAKK